MHPVSIHTNVVQIHAVSIHTNAVSIHTNEVQMHAVSIHTNAVSIHTNVVQMHAVSIHTNVVGGMIMTEPANDLAIAVAIASSYYEQPIARDIACIGEIGQSASLLHSVVLLCLRNVMHQKVHQSALTCYNKI